ncbi:hypothetical protein [Rhizobium sp. SL86]|uniref:hypothetical protein n=1 Tax=Rhizobium sp. SL86 TaxID=2995148 RepID=UPI00227373D5|nr:hypothetical protein [Rhizobium sp. SL86]MCY1668231.1 hypothetical protein [Rhizobium sp. SL86]
MHRWGVALLTATLAAVLAGCNTTDALTPQVDVGGGLFPSSTRSTPVSQDEARRLAATADPPASAYGTSSGPSAATNRTPPQNTMQAQAQALDSGDLSPVQSSPLPPPSAATTPSAQQSAPAVTQQQPAPGSEPPAGPSQTAALDPAASAAPSQASIRFLPIIGAPVQAVTPLSRQLGASARAGGLTIKSSSDTSSEHILKGYLSAFDNEGKVTVVYVWDVLDSAGARLHRIQGQETVPASGGDPWAAVPAATMQLIGQKTMSEYVQWRQSRNG